MGYTFNNLNSRTRELMLMEFDSDVANKQLYLSQRLTDEGVQQYPGLLRAAIANQDETWLANQLSPRSILLQFEGRRTKFGTVQQVRVPSNANLVMAYSEFNRYYVRGVCLLAIEKNEPEVIAYRARFSENPRPESQAIIGRAFDPQQLLDDLRNSPGVESSLGIPDVNSGISVHLP